MDINLTATSKSTDKLGVLMAGLAEWPDEAFSRIKSASITWESVSNGENYVIVPTLAIEFYEKA